MPLMCTKCFEIDRRKYRSYLFCKTEGCDGWFVEIDENFLQPISILNKKGYITEYCCSGHTFSKDLPESSYISFRKDIVLPSLPKGYKYDKEFYPENILKVIGERNVIRMHFDTNSRVMLQKYILESAINVLNWVIDLPLYKG